MPPALSDAGSSDSESEIAPRAVGIAQNGAEENEENDDDEEEEAEEDVYIVEVIKRHGWSDGGDLILFVKWQGYPNTENTWEPEENLLEAAEEVLQAYYNKIGGRPSKEDQRKKRKNGVDESTPQSGRGRKKFKADESHDYNGSQRRKRKEKEWEPPRGSWESEVTNIDSIEEHPDPTTGQIKRWIYVLWNNGKHTRHELSTMRVKAPQKMLDYFEQHLCFNSEQLPVNAKAADEDTSTQGDATQE